jgi:hypothetical protein
MFKVELRISVDYSKSRLLKIIFTCYNYIMFFLKNIHLSLKKYSRILYILCWILPSLLSTLSHATRAKDIVLRM